MSGMHVKAAPLQDEIVIFRIRKTLQSSRSNHYASEPEPQDHMVNVWGYSHINFFAPMARFAADGGGTFAAGREFKQLVQALHAAGIQVILDVVYNHTNEGAVVVVLDCWPPRRLPVHPGQALTLSMNVHEVVLLGCLHGWTA